MQLRASSVFVTLLLFCTISFSSCKKESNSGIGIDIVSVTTNEPANVRLLFQVNLGEQEVLSPLELENFEIYENNTLLTSLESQAQIQNEPGEYLNSTLLLLDFSGSVLNDDDLFHVKEAVRSFVQLVMPDTLETGFGVKEMAIYWFNGQAEIHPLVEYSIYKDSLLAGISTVTDSISNDFSTNLNGAIIEGAQSLVDKISEAESDLNLSSISNMVLFTDGIDLAGRETEETALASITALTNQFNVYSVGLGSDVNQNFLQQIGRNGFHFTMESVDLNSTFIEVAEVLNKDYLSFYALEYCSPKRSGEHLIQIRAVHEERVGRFDIDFSADGFGASCIIN